jgi:hypothetical protein
MMRMKKSALKNNLSAICFLLASGAFAQGNDQAMMKQIEQNNQATIDAISLYPTDTRRDILEAARYPELIVRLSALQKQSRDQFAELISPFSREDQEKIWNLTRYPALVSELAYDHPKSNAELGDILSRYPEEIHPAALDEAYRNYNVLVQIDQSNAGYQANLDQMLVTYPRVTASAYRNLIKQPEILSTLYDNMQTTVILGDIYKTDPQYVLFETDSLNQALTIQNQQAAQDWQQSIAQNPQAQQEYTQAAEEYAQENGYNPAEYQTPMDPVVTDFPVYPYNWWFGYPTWYVSPCWDPYPFWYDWGFYYGPGRVPVFFGMPSYHFMNWYFYNPEHWNRYPGFADHCYGYYVGHRGGRYSNPVSRGVNDWRRRNKDVVTKDWDNDKAGRVQRFREFGQMESERAKYNNANPGHPMERKDYLAQNQSRYSHTTVVPVSASRSGGSNYERTLPPHSEAPAIRPHTTIPSSYYRNNSNTTPTRTEPARNGQPSNGNPSRETRPAERQNGNNYHPAAPAQPVNNQTRQAQQFHQSSWQEMQPSRSSAPAQRSAPPARSAPSGDGGGGRRR